MLVLITLLALTAGLILGRLWGWLTQGSCPRCAIRDAEQATLWQLHSIEQQTAADLMQAAHTAMQSPQSHSPHTQRKG